MPDAVLPSTVDLPFIVERLSQAQFNRQLTVHQLADGGKSSLSIFQLVDLLHQCMLWLDEANPLSFHRGVDLRTEGPEATVERMLDFLRMLKFRGALADGGYLLLSEHWLSVLPTLTYALRS